MMTAASAPLETCLKIWRTFSGADQHATVLQTSVHREAAQKCSLLPCRSAFAKQSHACGAIASLCRCAALPNVNVTAGRMMVLVVLVGAQTG